MIVSVADVQAHLNLEGDEDTAVVERKIAAAQEWIARFTGVNFESYYIAPPPPPPPPDPPDPYYFEPEPFDSYATVPAPLKEAVRQLAAHFYENREAALVGVTASELPFGVIDLVAPYRTWVF
mgnify:CR=1 FL=1